MVNQRLIQMSTTDLLSMVYQDVQLLKSRQWEPDDDSCQATIDVLEALSQKLNITLQGLEADTADVETEESTNPDSLETYCESNPGSPECRIYDV
jgi:hypothetical protein